MHQLLKFKMTEPSANQSPQVNQSNQKLARETYISILKEILTKIQKTVPSKKYKELIEVCRQSIEQVDKDTEQKADKYFYILKMGLETGLPRLMTDILICIQKLYTYDCLIGDTQDNCLYPPDRKPPPKNGRLPRLLIDAIADSVMDCAQDSDNQVQLQVIKILLTIVISVNSKVHEITLLSTLRTQYSIYMTSTSQTNQKTAKAASTQMINTVFTRMDAYQRFGTNSYPLDLRKVEARLANTAFDKSLKKREESKEDIKNVASTQPIQAAFSPLDLYVHSIVRNMVDNVCLYEARIAEIKRLHMTEEADTARSDTQQIQQIIDAKVAKVPLNPIPQGKKDCPDVSITNELGFEAGRFGWCISCRNTANLWCKDTKHPICSEECKKKHFVESSCIDKQPDSNIPNFVKSSEANLALTDAHLVFRSIVKLACGDAQNGQLNRFVIKTKLIGLELILTVLSAPKQALMVRKEFISVIKGQLCEGLLRYSVSTELVIFQLVIDIFYCLFLNFRQHLKQIIRVFIETIFLKLLDSSNSSYQHKHLILGVFDKISRNTSMLLEIFVNYDCDISQKDLTETIIESMCKIANGRFTKSEHQNLINPTEALQLKNYATQILVQILRSFNGTIDAKIAEAKIIQRISSASLSKFSQPDEQQNDVFDIASQSPRSAHLEKKQNQIGDIQNQRNVKQEMSKAAKKFNFKPKNGISYLVAQKLITGPEDYKQHVKDIVKFLKTTPVLDKTQIGIFLGTNSDLCKDCLYQFIDEFDLRGMHYIPSLKTILSGFRLPGEGQCVDVIMEKFGFKFIQDNPSGTDGCQGVMTAECVYLLSYATMMMQTTLHNPNAVKSRMTLEDFTKMIKGINAGQNLEPEFVKKIYETVEREPFTLNEDDDARFKVEAANATTFKKKQELFQKESMSIFERGKNEMTSQNNSQYISVDDAAPIRPMFENTWSANLATLSMILEETVDDTISNLCIEGFILSIKICGYFNMKTERDAFVSSFAKFTMVTSERRLKPKNIMCIKSLMDLATYQGNYLGESWYFVLECVSCIEELINLGHGNAQDREFFDTQQSSHRLPSKGSIAGGATGQKQTKEANMAANSEIIVKSITIEQIDQIFQNSLNLDQDAIIHFIQSLCKVSKTELSDAANPRKFSLQALVEIADMNMVRVRFVWSKIWEMLSQHFVWVGSHSNLMVAIFAIDSLRQLADKFLKREEFGSFNFQKDFLKPFESIMLNNMHTRSEIKDYIVTCITSICVTKTNYIKSGWSIIINIFTLAAQDTEQQLVLQSFDALKMVITKHFDLLKLNFVELVNCLNKYSLNSRFAVQALQAQDLMLICADKLQDKSLIDYFISQQGLSFYNENLDNIERYPPQYGLAANKEFETEKNPIAGSVIDQKVSSQQPTEEQIELAVMKGLWFPLLQNISNLIIDKNQDRQQAAIDNLFGVMQKAATSSSAEFWREVFSQVLYPVLEDIQLAVETQQLNQDSQNQFHTETLQKIVERFATFLNENYKILPNVVTYYVDIICLFVSNIRDKRIALVIATSLTNLTQIIGEKLTAKEWDSFTTSLCLCFDATLPNLLLSEDPGNLDNMFTKCLVQLQLINCVKDTFQRNYKQFTNSNIRQILACLEVSNKFARQFNENIELRKQLWAAGFMKDVQQLPGLFTQEYKSLATIIQIRFIILFRQLNLESDEDEAATENELIQLCHQVMSDYSLKNSELANLKINREAKQDISVTTLIEELEKKIQNLTPIISNHILGNLLKLSDNQLRKRIKQLCPVLIEITLCQDQEVRNVNKELLERIFEMVI